MAKLVIAAAFTHPHEAHLAKTRLQSEGIECVVTDDNIVTMNWFLSNAVGGVKLRVKKSDLEIAKEILYKKPVETANEIEEYTLCCPACNSLEIRYEKFSNCVAFISFLFLSFSIPVPKRKWKCITCGHRWKEK